MWALGRSLGDEWMDGVDCGGRFDGWYDCFNGK